MEKKARDTVGLREPDGEGEALPAWEPTGTKNTAKSSTCNTQHGRRYGMADNQNSLSILVDKDKGLRP